MSEIAEQYIKRYKTILQDSISESRNLPPGRYFCISVKNMTKLINLFKEVLRKMEKEIKISEKDLIREDGKWKIILPDNIVSMIKGTVQLGGLLPGSIFRDSDGIEYIVLDHSKDTTAVIHKELLPTKMEFGSTNNWKNSNVRTYLNSTYYQELCKKFGQTNIVEHTTDLFSLDGLDDYGKTRDFVGLLTIDQYRRYRRVLGKNMDSWWWLATPDSTPSGWSSRCVQCVGGDGRVDYCGCGSARGVRPFFVLRNDVQIFR